MTTDSWLVRHAFNRKSLVRIWLYLVSQECYTRGDSGKEGILKQFRLDPAFSIPRFKRDPDRFLVKQGKGKHDEDKQSTLRILTTG